MIKLQKEVLMQKVLNEVKKIIMENKVYALKVFVVLIIVILASYSFFNREKEDDVEISKVDDGQAAAISEDVLDVDSQEGQPASLVVDVSGQVKNPMVVELPPSSRIDDAINAAGGLTKQADVDKINRAEVISDGQKIYVPAIAAGTEEGGLFNKDQVEENGSGKVNINTAGISELQNIPGVGPATAQKIESYRSQHGSFKKIEDIKKVSGIGEKTFEKMKDLICV